MPIVLTRKDKGRGKKGYNRLLRRSARSTIRKVLIYNINLKIITNASAPFFL
jgi:hypothetical protein